MLTACATQTTKQNFAKATSINERQFDIIPTKKPLDIMAASQDGKGRNIVGKPYSIKGKWYFPSEEQKYTQIGHASWYGSYFHGRLTANGEVYDMNSLTAAHPTMPLPSYARITNVENGSSIVVRVNDRGPFAKDRLVDLSKRAAIMLDYKDNGVANVKVEYLGRAPIEGDDSAYLLASFEPGDNVTNTALAMAGLKETNLNPNEDNSKKAINSILTPSELPNLPEIGPLLISKPIEPQLSAQASETVSYNIENSADFKQYKRISSQFNINNL